MAIAVGPWNDTYEVPDPVETVPAEKTENSDQVSSELTPPVVEPVIEAVETPVVETTEPPVVETPTPTTVEVIKEVEKIVEKYPAMDEHTQAIFDALMEGKEDVLLNFLSEKHKDFKTMSDYDVVKESLKKNNPTWSPEEVELELKYKYGEELTKWDLSKIDKDIEPEEYNRALQHNQAVERNEILLKRDARDARIALEQTKKDIKLPKIEKQVEQPIATGPTPEEIAENAMVWHAKVDKEVPEVKEFTFKVGDKDSGYEDVVYNVTDAQRAEQSTFLKDVDLPKLFNRLGWMDENGVQNVAKMAGDVLKLENVAQLIQSAYTQGKTAGSKGIIAEIKQVDLKNNNAQSVQATPPDIGQVVWGHLNPK